MKRTDVIILTAVFILAGIFASDTAFCMQKKRVDAPVRTETENYMDFLYGVMTLPDSLVFPRDWWMSNIEKTLQVREKMNWNIPEREFKHFVLPLRVNNEGLDDFRILYADELCERVKGMSMYDAVLEINHWCHERVTYKSSDGRTSAPVATIRYGFGRCGEESVLTVAALRAAGIPARQVYTPRWAHTDDNHAWVEAWVDGEWHFLGACEPEAALDMGWFNAPVSRAMLLHTNVIGNYDGPEDVIRRDGLYTEINLTSLYVPVRRNVVRVVDRQGHPVEGVSVEFRLYNYAELYPLAKYVTGADGLVEMESGLGDMVAWAYKDGKFGVAAVRSEYTGMTLDFNEGDELSLDFHLVPPAENPLPSIATPEMVAANKVRLKKEDAMRAEMHKEKVNGQVIDGFRNSAVTDADKRKVDIVLSSISKKDFRDISAEVLRDAVSCDLPEDPYVLSPRIEMEYLYPFHKEMNEGLRDVIHNCDEAIRWVKGNIRIVEGRNPNRFRIPPIAVWRSRLCDKPSLDIFFVAVCRSVGIPAAISMADGGIYVMENGSWLSVNLSEATAEAVPKSKLHLEVPENGQGKAPEYYRNFTISRLRNGSPSLLEYDENQELPGYDFKLEKGCYLITCGTRMPDGSVLVSLQTVNMQEGKDETITLSLPTTDKLYAKVGKDGSITAFLAGNGEPTLHALRELESISDVLNAWEGKILVYGPSAESLDFYRSFLGPVKNISYGIGTSDTDEILPVIDLKDGNGKVVFHSHGYNTSLGGELSKYLEDYRNR